MRIFLRSSYLPKTFFHNLPKYFIKADLIAKRQLIGSVYPEKLIFENKNFRTIRMLPTVEWMIRQGKGSTRLNNKKASKNGGQFNEVPRNGFEPSHLAAPPPEDGASTNFATW